MTTESNTCDILELQVTAVVAVGLVEGTTHVNWAKVKQILGWWIATLIPLFLITAALFGQGMAALCSCSHAYASLPSHLYQSQVRTRYSRPQHVSCICAFHPGSG